MADIYIYIYCEVTQLQWAARAARREQWVVAPQLQWAARAARARREQWVAAPQESTLLHSHDKNRYPFILMEMVSV